MTGRLIAVVGPSGVGKDTVMEALAATVPNLSCVRRVITRAADAGGEDYDPVSEAAFADMERQGSFLLSWRAHGLAYGIPRSVCSTLDAGEDRLVNLSRSVLEDAAKRVPTLMVLSLTARPDVLAHRLSARGRESVADISARLARSSSIPAHLPVFEIDNSGSLEETVHLAVTAIYPEVAEQGS